jgi:hypothetical protein
MGVPNAALVCDRVVMVVMAVKFPPCSAIGWWLHVALQGNMQG